MNGLCIQSGNDNKVKLDDRNSITAGKLNILYIPTVLFFLFKFLLWNEKSVIAIQSKRTHVLKWILNLVLLRNWRCLANQLEFTFSFSFCALLTKQSLFFSIQ